MDRIYSDFWNGSSWMTSMTDVFVYDENGNCAEWVYYNGNEVFNRFEYEYDLNYSVDQIVYPYSPEDDIATKSMVEKNNKDLFSHWYAQNDNAELIYVCDYIYNYNQIGELGTQTQASLASEILVYPNPSSAMIHISAGELTIKNQEIINTTGQIIWNKSQVNQKEFKLDISHLKSGVYFARIRTSKGIVTKKISVK